MADHSVCCFGRSSGIWREQVAELPEKAYEDVVNVYNTKAMKEKYIKFYNKIEED